MHAAQGGAGRAVGSEASDALVMERGQGASKMDRKTCVQKKNGKNTEDKHEPVQTKMVRI